MASMLTAYTYRATVLGQYEYAFVGEHFSFDNADVICKSLGGKLASITNAADNTKLYNLLVELGQVVDPGSKELREALLLLSAS